MAEERFIDVARRIVEGETSAPASAYRRLQNCIENKGGEITLSDRELVLAAAHANRIGMTLTVGAALDELSLRLVSDETSEQTERRMAA